ncbi:Uncharacterized protein OS=Isosphaera pallida (strain ATCC 43644 / DSM 9630 / IS1B) GN=Isop_2058 PE=4 SV=1: SBP_bac_10 [Gemmata massiliana]|uniref:DUF1559 domain-containing protein n=1 Tax=Gemmata massiliana TaxID=1210884 RepID=A0A6P2D3M9_9BACT|nr:Uncharacterized protein OS=Isosphaera pallida (strain ATCC 43644 / DSM 9630 / IS1B) GN=Isop_2058 PE=4 SV=1: SBP_bac_10 [Gemmata massiliana]
MTKAEVFGPAWVMHVNSYMEQTTLDQRVQQGVAADDLNESCPWDNLDGLPQRRPDIDTQSYIRKFMQCPSAEQSEIHYNDLSLENLYKGNYVACFGGGFMRDATSRGNSQLAGVFKAVTDVKKFPYGERFAVGKGTRITGIGDGTSNTVMLSELLANLVADGRTSSTSSAMNRDVRGAMLCPMMGGNSFSGAFPPNSRGTDITQGCPPRVIRPRNRPAIQCFALWTATSIPPPEGNGPSPHAANTRGESTRYLPTGPFVSSARALASNSGRPCVPRTAARS